VKISGVPTRSIRHGATRRAEDVGARVLRAGYHVDYTGQSRQARQEQRKIPSKAFALAVHRRHLSRARPRSQLSAIRSFIHRGSVFAARDGSARSSHVPSSSRAHRVSAFRRTKGWDAEVHITRGGPRHARGLVSKNGILNSESRTAVKRRASKLDAVREARAPRFGPIMMTTSRDRGNFR